MTTARRDPSTVDRQAWLAVLARAPGADLARLADPLLAGERFESLREPEVGLIMLRGRIGHSGDRFNLGEATLTRCVQRWLVEGRPAHIGVGYVLGRDTERARRIARLDALLQQDDRRAALMQAVVEPLAAQRAQRDAEDIARAASSRVRFVALQAQQD